MTKEGYLEATY